MAEWGCNIPDGGLFVKLIVINQAEATALLTMKECLGVMEKTLQDICQGRAIQPLRSVIQIPGGNVMAMMPSCLGDITGAKVITVFPGNHGTEFDAHQGAILVFETGHGCLRAIVDATAITAIRTGAVGGVATNLLANPDAGDLAILGAGTQGSVHLEAISLVRKLRRVRVWDLFPERAEVFAKKERERSGLPVEATASPRDAVAGADIICTTTPSQEPVLLGEWLSPGAHINAIGASQPPARELDSRAVVMSRMFVDWKESTVKEAADYLFALKEGAIQESHIIGNIGDVALNRLEGRRSREEITLFKAVGLAVEDLSAAGYVWRKAAVSGVGTVLELGGRHVDNAAGRET
ncbi:MAG: ornithine cyclodeaminase family protein [Syntrophorhabdales bacterium]|jgi:ornithine cyclodeaminase